MILTAWEPDLRTIVDRIDNHDIDLQPDFQRQEVWSSAKKRKLIDTILRGWSIPPVFLVVTKEGRMDVLDGQQRLAAIRDFLHDRFSIDGNITPSDDNISALHGKFYTRLDAVTKRLIDQHSLRCFRITDYRPDEPSELFYRLNQPSMLTAGEQRNAFYGPAREQLKELVAAFELEGNSKETIGFSNARLAYDDVIARLLFFLERQSFAIKGTEALISQRFKEREGFSDQVFACALQVIDLFSRCRAVAERVRLNKAAALSWMLFFCRFAGEVKPDLAFMARFAGAETRGQFSASEAHELFQDRASLRVTDVSSVVYRDVALWLSYTNEFGNAPPPSVRVDYLDEISSIAVPRFEKSLEEIISEVISIEAWSSLRAVC